MGDVVCTLPVASALKTLGPDVSVTWVVDPRFAGPVECCKAVDEIVMAKPGIGPSTRRVTHGEFEAALDMQGLLKSAVIVGTAKAGQKLGFHWQREGAGLFSHRVVPDPTSLHVVDQYVDVARYLGATVNRADFALEPKPDDLTKWHAELAPFGQFVVLNAGAGWAIKRWPPSFFATLSNALLDAGFQPVFIGSKADADQEAYASVVESGARNTVSLLGKTNIRELIAVLSLAKLHVGGDTGSTHISAALGIPCVGLYSNNRPERTCPYGQIDRCLYDPEGLANITPEAVLEKCMEALAH